MHSLCCRHGDLCASGGNKWVPDWKSSARIKKKKKNPQFKNQVRVRQQRGQTLITFSDKSMNWFHGWTKEPTATTGRRNPAGWLLIESLRLHDSLHEQTLFYWPENIKKNLPYYQTINIPFINPNITIISPNTCIGIHIFVRTVIHIRYPPPSP